MENILETKKKFTVDRRTWARGGKNGTPALLNDQGNQCCLGFVCEQSGAEKRDMLSVATPTNLVNWRMKDVPGKRGRLTFLLTFSNNVWLNSVMVNFAMGINDDKFICDEEREKQLSALFLENGYEIEFIN